MPVSISLENSPKSVSTGRINLIRRDSLHWKKFAGSIIRGDTMLSKDFREFIVLLNKHSVKYLVVGGYAVAIHGYPRYTKDLDVWIALSEENADKILKTLDDFGFGKLKLTSEDFTEPDQVIQLGFPPNQIDIITSLTGVDFDSCYGDRIVVNIDGIDIEFIDRENLRRNKLAIGRARDLADAENI